MHKTRRTGCTILALLRMGETQLKWGCQDIGVRDKEPPESGSRLAPVQALYAPPRAPTPLRARSGGTGVPS
eukprot:scaffold23010_cov54-Phaeocystis_antarctica.AAC.4